MTTTTDEIVFTTASEDYDFDAFAEEEILPTVDPEQKRYVLWLTIEDETEREIAQAIGSPFWSEIWTLAKTLYGEDNLRVSFE